MVILIIILIILIALLILFIYSSLILSKREDEFIDKITTFK